MTENEKGKKPAEAKAETKPEAPAPGIDLTDLVDRTAERIAFLKKQQEDLARQKDELEELSRQKKELEKSRREILVSLERALSVLQNEENDLQRKHSLVQTTRNEFGKILKEVRGIREGEWRKENVKEELSHALALVAKAHRDFRKAQGQIEAIAARDLEGGRERPLPPPAAIPEILPARPGELFKQGLVFFLPAALLALLVAILLRIIALLQAV